MHKSSLITNNVFKRPNGLALIENLLILFHLQRNSNCQENYYLLIYFEEKVFICQVSLKWNLSLTFPHAVQNLKLFDF